MPSSILASGEVTEFHTIETQFNLDLTKVKHNVG